MEDTGIFFGILGVIIFVTFLSLKGCQDTKIDTIEANRKTLCHQATGMYLEGRCYKQSDTISLIIPPYKP